MAPDLRGVERALWEKGHRTIAGVDEAGRGPLAGPVVAAACVCAHSVDIPGIDDSKRLSRCKRVALFEALYSHDEVLIGVGIVDAMTIDRINILQATIRAMHAALEQLATEIDHVVVDGHPIPHPTYPVSGVVGGDGSVYPVAAASIIAKETRDRIMERYHEQWPWYGFAQHKGYGTAAHREALRTHGPSPIHRATFRL